MLGGLGVAVLVFWGCRFYFFLAHSLDELVKLDILSVGLLVLFFDRLLMGDGAAVHRIITIHFEIPFVNILHHLIINKNAQIPLLKLLLALKPHKKRFHNLLILFPNLILNLHPRKCRFLATLTPRFPCRPRPLPLMPKIIDNHVLVLVLFALLGY